MVSRFLGGLLFWLFLAVVGLLIIAVVIAWSVGVGWLVTKLLPFTLFEATLLGMLASLLAIHLVGRLMNLGHEVELEDTAVSATFPSGSFVLPEDGIPASRFVQSEEDETDESWFRYQIANDIYDDLLAELDLDATMGETQVKELAVRLTDVVTAVFKARPRKPRSQRVTITVAQLKKQMDKMELRPYDNDILKTTAHAVNERLSYDDELADIVRQKTWHDVY